MIRCRNRIHRAKEPSAGILVTIKFYFVVFAVVLTFDGLAGAQADRFSPACARIRADAMLSYFKKDFDPKVARIAQVLSSYESEEITMALLAEVLSGRITVEQLGGSEVTGLDAMDDSPACNDHDRERSDRARSLLPSILSDIRKTVEKMSRPH